MICTKCCKYSVYKKHKLCLQCLISERERAKLNYLNNSAHIKNRNKISSKNRYYRNKKNKLCVRCGKKTEKNKTMCKICSFKQNKRLNNKRYNREINNLCLKCGNERYLNYRVCLKCYIQLKKARNIKNNIKED